MLGLIVASGVAFMLGFTLCAVLAVGRGADGAEGRHRE